MSEINATPAPATPGQLGRDLATAVVLFHETLARRAGMSAAESRCLGTLGQLGVATAGQLATATGLTTGAITGIVDRLEKAGYARREPNPKDRRSVLIRPLPHPKLAAMLAPAYQKLRDAMASVGANFTPTELDVIARYLAQATDTLRVLTAELRHDGNSK